MGETAKRVFLGWERGLLARAAEWLSETYGEDMSAVRVALPGGRAGRKLLEKLARCQPASWCPPRILTQGELTDELVRWESAPANRIVRTLAWERALRAIPKKELNCCSVSESALAKGKAKSSASGAGPSAGIEP